jgi:hypothetical protein
MFEILFSVVSGFFVGSTISCIRDGVTINAFHHPAAQAEFDAQYGEDIDRRIKQINWDVNDLNPHWFDD